MKDILLKQITLPDESIADVLIHDGIFKTIAKQIDTQKDTIVIDGRDKAILPAFYNTHNHAAMTLLRGYADDMELHKWLTEYIWPYEAKMTDEDIYLGTKLAILEMIKSGTVFFNDMYWKHGAVLKAVQETGIRACIGCLVLGDNPQLIEDGCDFIKAHKNDSPLIQFSIDPHAVYTTSLDFYQKTAQFAEEQGIYLHTHLSETVSEVENCYKEHGVSPVRYLADAGVLSKRTIAAHCVHCSDDDIELLRQHDVVVAHNPVSNMKLNSGYAPIEKFLKQGVRVALGTDGCSSNNNLDMREEMKFASLLGKLHGAAESLPVETVMKMACQTGAEAFGINGGVIAEGKVADCLLIKLDNVAMQPCYHLLSNWVYAAQSEIIDTVICNGDILMQDRKVAFEDELIATIRERYV